MGWQWNGSCFRNLKILQKNLEQLRNLLLGCHGVLKLSNTKGESFMKNTDDKNIHAGHRGRLLDTVYNVGIESVSEIQAMEFILTYIFPRGDVNPLAHRLLDKFGSIANVLDADLGELVTVHGIGDRAGKMIKELTEIFFLYSTCKRSKRENIAGYNNLYDYSEQLLRFKNVEEFYIVGLDSLKNIVGRRKLASGTINMVGITPLQISSFLTSTHSAMVFIAHNHPGGKAVPSEQDKTATVYMKNLFSALGVTYIDHILVGADGLFSFESNKRVREFF